MDAIKKRTVLAVDDERANLLVLNRILGADYNVITAKTGGDALRRAGEEMPDLILLDVVMPDMSGFDVLRELKKRRETQSIPVIVITGLAGEKDERTGMELGAAGYIVKPFSHDTVRACVGRHIDGDTPPA